MSATPHDGAGTVLTLHGTVYTVTNIVISYADPAADEEKINVSHLGQTAGATALTMDFPLKGSASGDTGRTVQFDYIGRVIIADGATGTFTLTSGGATLLNGLASTVQSSTLTLATNDAIRGQATVRIARA